MMQNRLWTYSLVHVSWINLISCSWLFYISYLYPSTLVVTTYSSILYYCTYICTVYSVLQSEHVLRAVTFHRFYCTVGLVPLLCTTFQLLTKYISYKHSKSLAWPTLWKTQCMVFWSYLKSKNKKIHKKTKKIVKKIKKKKKILKIKMSIIIHRRENKTVVFFLNLMKNMPL